MSPTPAERLYTPAILALAVRLAGYPLTKTFPYSGEAQSRSCGSSLEIGLSLNQEQLIDGIGIRASACAIGQAAAAIFAAHSAGVPARELETDLNQIDKWLSADGAVPDWPEITALEAARGHIGRHGAILLPWRAAIAALSKHELAG